jgi:general secretion pathway protein I
MVMLKKYRSQRGATLLEVMIAVAIASIALVSLVSLVLTSLQMEDYSRTITEAILIADNRMKEIERFGFPEIGEKEGLIDEKDPTGYAYKQVITDSPIENVRNVKLTLYWNRKKDSVSLEAYMMKK